MSEPAKLIEPLHYEVGRHPCVNQFGQPLTYWKAPCPLFDPWRMRELGFLEKRKTRIHELRFFQRRVSRLKLRSFYDDQIQLRLIELERILVLLHCLGQDFAWDYIDYSYHLDDPTERSIPPTDLESATFRTTLIDAGSGIVKAVRLHDLSKDFTQALHNTIADQARSPVISYQDVHQIMRQYLTVEFLLSLPHIVFSSVTPTTLIQP